MLKSDASDKKDARTLAILLLVLLLALLLVAWLALPTLAEFNQQYLAPGVGLKQAALSAFISTIVLFVVFAFVAGDGLLGELQFMLMGFFAFFIVLWLLIAWWF